MCEIRATGFERIIVMSYRPSLEIWGPDSGLSRRVNLDTSSSAECNSIASKRAMWVPPWRTPRSLEKGVLRTHNNTQKSLPISTLRLESAP